MLDIYIYEPDAELRRRIHEYCFEYLIRNDIPSEIKTITANEKEAEEAFSQEEFQSIFIIFCDKFTDTLITALRKKNKDSYVIITANDFNDIVTYMKPGHRPSGFIIKPLTKNDINKLMGDIMSDYNSKRHDNLNDCFRFKLKSTEYNIPYDAVLYFESNNKKMIARTAEKEYFFYSSFDELQNVLPDGFIRIHKSYIVNVAHIESINYSDNEIFMDNGMSIYFSRTYRSIVKECFNARPEIIK